jgi:hypothetical protein
LVLVLDAVVTHAAAGSPPPPLAPPAITVLKSEHGQDRGLIFVAPKTKPADGLQQGPEIVDPQGRPVWFRTVPAGEQGANFRVQT